MEQPTIRQRVQAWDVTAPGHVGYRVYTQSIALDKFNELGADAEMRILAITRWSDGSRSYDYGVVL